MKRCNYQPRGPAYLCQSVIKETADRCRWHTPEAIAADKEKLAAVQRCRATRGHGSPCWVVVKKRGDRCGHHDERRKAQRKQKRAMRIEELRTLRRGAARLLRVSIVARVFEYLSHNPDVRLSYATIAKATGDRPNTVRYVIAGLRRDGHITELDWGASGAQLARYSYKVTL